MAEFSDNAAGMKWEVGQTSYVTDGDEFGPIRADEWAASFKGIVSRTLDWPTCPTCQRPAPPEALGG